MGMYGAGVDVTVDCQAADDGLTKQAPSKSCDINYIVAQYQKTGVLPINIRPRVPVYADVSEFADYHTAMNLICKANDMFAALPVLVRERFDNDPGKMVAFLEDARNLDEARKLGLVEPAKVVSPSVSPKSGDGGVFTPSSDGGAIAAPNAAPKAS